MTGLLLPATEQTQLTGAIRSLWKTATPCRTDPVPARWKSDRKGTLKLLDEAYARSVCHTCNYRAMCAAWAFEMEDYWLWAGFTAVERRWLRDKRPDLVEAVVNLVREYLMPGERLGFAERAEEVMARLDVALPGGLVPRGTSRDVDDGVESGHNVAR